SDVRLHNLCCVCRCTILAARFDVVGVHPRTKSKRFVDRESTDVERSNPCWGGDKYFLMFDTIEKGSQERGLTGTRFAGNKNVMASVNLVYCVFKLNGDGNNHELSRRFYMF